MSYLDNLKLAIDQKSQGVTGDQTSSWDRVGNTLDDVVGGGKDKPGVLGNFGASAVAAAEAWDHIGDKVPDPSSPDGMRPPTTGEEVARTLRAVQQAVGLVMGAWNLPLDMLNMGFADLTAPLAAIFPSLPAATLMMPFVGIPHCHTHPPAMPAPLPSIGMVLPLSCCVRVLINYMPAARADDIGLALVCGSTTPWFEIFLGSSNVFIGGKRAARMLDVSIACKPGGGGGEAAGALAKISEGIAVAGVVAGALGIAADVAEAAVEDSEAMAAAKALSAAMNAAQMAADAAAMAVKAMVGKDTGAPPSVGALMMGMPNVLIGGFPMINFPNPAELLLHALGRLKASPPEEEEPENSKSGSPDN
jgi:uncharacterized Zn-binding protein involved in type VI secretion